MINYVKSVQLRYNSRVWNQKVWQRKQISEHINTYSIIIPYEPLRKYRNDNGETVKMETVWRLCCCTNCIFIHKVLINIFGKMYNCHILIFSWLFFNIIVLPDHNITATEDDEGKVEYYTLKILSPFQKTIAFQIWK